MQRLTTEACGAPFPPDDDESQTSGASEEVYSNREMARDIESGRTFGRSHGGGHKRRTRKTKVDAAVVKTCRCICPLQHELLKKEIANATLLHKKLKLEVAQLEKSK